MDFNLQFFTPKDGHSDESFLKDNYKKNVGAYFANLDTIKKNFPLLNKELSGLKEVDAYYFDEKGRHKKGVDMYSEKAPIDIRYMDSAQFLMGKIGKDINEIDKNYCINDIKNKFSKEINSKYESTIHTYKYVASHLHMMEYQPYGAFCMSQCCRRHLL